ncbi:methyltransferase [Novosphingobium sp. FSY-8]|uniref:Methyltransferase n=1 Tax=Novosphingobium ovatum TaxID=1908523 RepID=A0ABW9XDN4_9SPHN|nr:methyltransferase [Novosphingobium ovatum]
MFRRAVLAASALIGAGALMLPAAATQAQTAPAVTKPAPAPSMAQILADPRRKDDTARDKYRHPAQTLAFFRVKPGMTVVDYMPSGGWWTRILVPYLGENGHYIGLNPDVSKDGEQTRNFLGGLANSFPAKAAEYTGVPVERLPAYNTDGLPAALNGTVDRVLIFREMHNLWRGNWMRRELLAIHGLLKPDGLLGIEQHRAKPGAPAARTIGNDGYLRERDVIAMVEAHGFELVAKSEVNANPRDPANHPEGVWMLPPFLRGAKTDADRARMTAIGESDRMTLLFRKRP